MTHPLCYDVIPTSYHVITQWILNFHTYSDVTKSASFCLTENPETV